MAKVLLEMKNITKTFGNIIANKDVNLTVNRGEVLSILGENGSRKTHFAYCVIITDMLYYAPSSGKGAYTSV